MKQTRSNTPNYLKHLNKKKILQYLRDNSETSRAEISSALSISKPTVSAIVDELIAEEWLYEKESAVASSLGGRKPIHLFFNHSAYYMVGIDIGGTLVEIGLLNMAGGILALERFETQVALKEEDLLSKICNTVKGLLQKETLASEKILAVGVGAPGITDTEKGIVIDAPSLGWVNFPLRTELEKQLRLPTYVDNDVNVAVLGEQWKGKARDAENIILITLGTGVGCGIIVNGQLYRGSAYAAGEIGYMITDKNEAKEEYDDIFKGYGFLDSHVGGPSIVKRMERKLKTTTMDHPLKSERLTAKRIFDYAKKNDPLASEVIDETVDHIAYALVNVICIFNPQYVILGGGISKSADWFIPKIEKVLEKHLPLQTEISTTKLDNLSIIGAGALCLREHESLLKDEGVV